MKLTLSQSRPVAQRVAPRGRWEHVLGRAVGVPISVSAPAPAPAPASSAPGARRRLRSDRRVAASWNLRALLSRGPFMATLEDNATDSQPRFETRDFVLAHSFRKSGDKGVVSGLNSANSGAPISLQLHFTPTPTLLFPSPSRLSSNRRIPCTSSPTASPRHKFELLRNFQ